MDPQLPPPVIVWFRDDLRIADHPALSAATSSSRPVVCVFIHETHLDIRPYGAASKWWLHNALVDLDHSLQAIGGVLVLRSGDPQEVLRKLVRQTAADTVYWNRRYAPGACRVDARIRDRLRLDGQMVKSFNGTLLNEPWEIKTGSGNPYRVFTPYWRACLRKRNFKTPLAAPKQILAPDMAVASESLESWQLLPKNPNWAMMFSRYWQPGATGAGKRLEQFLDSKVYAYRTRRNFPGIPSTSGLSPHLRFGEISPGQIWQAITFKTGGVETADSDKFKTELGWREFSKMLLFYAENLSEINWNPGFDTFPWQKDEHAFRAWVRGQTGYPLVDAGMRELWATGWMHNRVRMVTASFLVKHLLIDWQEGEKWFWDTLVDADSASNPASWQWVAGSGADAAPFFRIFNPVKQSETFDPDGIYIRKWVPEIAHLDNRTIHKPWLSKNPANYPKPVIDHKYARKRALSAYRSLKN